MRLPVPPYEPQRSRSSDGAVCPRRNDANRLPPHTRRIFLDALLKLDLPVDRILMLWRAEGYHRLERLEYGVALDGRSVGLLDGAETGGYPGFVGGDGLAVA